MSIVGFDVGNESCIVAVARKRIIDVVLNDESKGETSAIVCFGEEQRFIGTARASSSLMNSKNDISHIKRLIGKQFRDPEVQRDLQSLPFTVDEGSDGDVRIHARYLGDNRAFTATQILAMIFSNLKQIAKPHLKTEVVDCCIGIPIYFTDLQRRAFLDVAAIAGLNPLRLMRETTATALAYSIYKTDLPENDPLNVVFVDMQVCVAALLIEIAQIPIADGVTLCRRLSFQRSCLAFIFRAPFYPHWSTELQSALPFVGSLLFMLSALAVEAISVQSVNTSSS